MTLAQKLNRIPPNFCRLLARKKNGLRMMTQLEIAQRAGVSKNAIVRISRLRTWDTLPLWEIEAFAGACGVDLLRPGHHLEFLRRRTLAYMDRARPAQKRMLDRLLAELGG